jgi:bifunctional DNase/RNase
VPGEDYGNERGDQGEQDGEAAGHGVTLLYGSDRRSVFLWALQCVKTQGAPSRMQEMVIYGVSFDMVGKQPIVLLKTADGNKFLPIWIGHPEAAAILMKLQGASTPRPMTHDLFNDVIGQLEAKVAKIAVTELRDNTFYAVITMVVNGDEIEIDSRPSDAIALAVRAGAPIFAADAVIEESGIEFEHESENEDELVDEFKKFLDEVKPEDFSSES